jgi:methylmalonyl-CoA epimerase
MQFTIGKLDHIGVAVENFDDALKFYQTQLGLTLTGIEDIPDQMVRTAFLQLNDTNIELLVPTDPKSPIKKFLSKHGKGIHHIAFEVDDINKALEELKNQGVRLIDEKPRIGAHNKKIAFIHPGAADGVLIELCEESKK